MRTENSHAINRPVRAHGAPYALCYVRKIKLLIYVFNNVEHLSLERSNLSRYT